jgi:hypothetical protein
MGFSRFFAASPLPDGRTNLRKMIARSSNFYAQTDSVPKDDAPKRGRFDGRILHMVCIRRTTATYGAFYSV